MKKLLPFFVGIALIGGGCFNPPVAEKPTPKPQGPQATYVGCTPKAMTILEPVPGATVTLPFTVKARVHNAERPDCPWTVFEAQAASMRLLDTNGATVGTGILMTSQDWMTDGSIEFTGDIPAIAVVQGQATLIITEENPSGEGTPEEIMIPLVVN